MTLVDRRHRSYRVRRHGVGSGADAGGVVPRLAGHRRRLPRVDAGGRGVRQPGGGLLGRGPGRRGARGDCAGARPRAAARTLVVVEHDPDARRPGLRAGGGRGRGVCPRRRDRAPGPVRVRHPRPVALLRRRRTPWPQRVGRGGRPVASRRCGRRTVRRRAGGAARRVVVPPGESAAFLAPFPVVARWNGPSWPTCCAGSGSAPSATWPRCPSPTVAGPLRARRRCAPTGWPGPRRAAARGPHAAARPHGEHRARPAGRAGRRRRLRGQGAGRRAARGAGRPRPGLHRVSPSRPRPSTASHLARLWRHDGALHRGRCSPSGCAGSSTAGSTAPAATVRRPASRCCAWCPTRSCPTTAASSASGAATAAGRPTRAGSRAGPRAGHARPRGRGHRCLSPVAAARPSRCASSRGATRARRRPSTAARAPVARARCRHPRRPSSIARAGRRGGRRRRRARSASPAAACVTATRRACRSTVGRGPTSRPGPGRGRSTSGGGTAGAPPPGPLPGRHRRRPRPPARRSRAAVVRRSHATTERMGFNNPDMPWARARAPAVRRAAATAADGDGGDSPAWSRKRQPYEPPPIAAPARRRRALRRAALPLELQLPRRRVPSRGAGRGGGPARPRGAGPHRPRRLLRRGPLRRGGPRRRAAHGLRRRAEPRARPARRTASPTPRATTCSCWPATRRATPAWPAPSARRSCAGGEKGKPDLRRSPSWPTLHGGHWLVLTGCRKGTVPAALVERRPGRGRRASWPTWSTLLRARQRRRRAVGPRRPARLGPQRRAGRAGAARRRRRRRHQQRPLRHARAPPAGHRAGRGAGPAQPRRDRRLAAGRRPTAHLRSGAEQARRFARYPGVVERAAELGRACAFDLALVAPNLPPSRCPPGHTEMT